MIFSGQEDIKELKALYKKALKNNGLKMKDAASAAGLTAQNFNSRFLRRGFDIVELARLCSAAGLALQIDIISADDLQTAGAPAGRDPGNI